MHWSKLAGVALAIVGGLVLTSSSNEAVGGPTGDCVTVYTEPLGSYIRTDLGNLTSGTVTVPVNVDGVSTPAAATLTVALPPIATQARITCSVDLGGGDTFSFGANMTPATSTQYTFTTADSFVGTGKYAGATGNLTFARTNGASQLNTRNSNVLEWGFTGTICFPPPVADDACENGKPSALLLRYTGEGPAGSDNSQATDKAVITGDAKFATPVRIRVTDRRRPFDSKGRVYFDGTVALNGVYTIDAATLGLRTLRSTTFVYIFDASGNLLESDEFHTSCSQPLLTGDKYGSTELLAFTTAPKPGKGVKMKTAKAKKMKKAKKK